MSNGRTKIGGLNSNKVRAALYYARKQRLTRIPVPQNITAPAITGTGSVDEVLTATPGEWAYSPTGYTYQWRRDEVNIEGETNRTYTVVADDVGTNIDCVVTASNAGGTASEDSNDIGVT